MSAPTPASTPTFGARPAQFSRPAFAASPAAADAVDMGSVVHRSPRASQSEGALLLQEDGALHLDAPAAAGLCLAAAGCTHALSVSCSVGLTRLP